MILRLILVCQDQEGHGYTPVVFAQPFLKLTDSKKEAESFGNGVK